MKKWAFIASCAVVVSTGLTPASFAAPPANDDCANTQPITGAGPFSFDLTEATTGVNGVFVPNCDLGGITIGHDIWYCWTSNCNGLVEFSTCGQTQVDTKIRIYAGCTCPADVGQPLCCSDNDCGKQTRVVCDAVCGATYLIQVGTPGFAPGGPGSLTITCLEETCPGEEPGDCDCCGARPPLVESLSTPFNPGLLAATTNFQFAGTDPAVYVIDLGNQGSAPLGSNWNTQRYTAADWTMDKLGGVFGVTLDNVGNVYVAHTSNYGVFATDPLGSLGGAGSIYILNANTGAASELVRLPNALDPVIVGQGQAGQAYPGLGNLTFDCNSDRLYAANLEDGRIYSIDPGNAGQPVRDTYDITTGVTTGPLPTNALAEPGDRPGWVPLGQRPYAVKAQNGRLYYSVWAGSIFSGGPNTIRSVQLNGAGDFVAGTDQLELTIPAVPGNPGSNATVDITFDDECCLLIAERGIDEIQTGAHSSRVMKFCRDATGGFDPNGFLYSIGDAGCIGQLNSAGGVGFEVGASNVWAMGDALLICSGVNVYGLQGQPDTGAPINLSMLVDLDGITTQQQKNQLGSLEVNCLDAQPPCLTVTEEDILCKEDGSFDYTFTVTNQSGQTAAVLILPDPNMSPNVIPLNPPLASGNSTTVTVNLNGPLPGTQFCFEMILGSIQGQVCCHLEHCVELPDCECAEISQVGVTATSTPGVFDVTFTLTNLEPWLMGHISLFTTGGNGTLTPALLTVPATPMWGSQVLGPITINTTVAPGSQFCFTIGNHSMDWIQCCFVELCVTVPTPSPSTNPADLDNDGDVDAADLAMLLGAWGSSGPGDLNGDGTVNAADLAILLGSWGQ